MLCVAPHAPRVCPQANFNVTRAPDERERAVQAVLERELQQEASQQQQQAPDARPGAGVRVVASRTMDGKLGEVTALATQGYKAPFVALMRKLREE